MQKKIVFETTKEAAPFPVVLDMEDAPFPGRYKYCMCLDHFTFLLYREVGKRGSSWIIESTICWIWDNVNVKHISNKLNFIIT